ncbi:MAG: hypothetical protein ACREA0_27235 [bacterium]
MILATVVAVPPASAASLHMTFPLVGTLSSPCTGELIAFTGNMHVLIGQFVDGTGALEITLDSNFQGVTGTGLFTGTRYEIPASARQIMSVGLPPVTVTQSNDVRVVGGQDNFSGSLPLTVTIGGTGGVSAGLGPLQFACN